MESVKTLIIGAGVIGLAIAAELGGEGVYVLEKNEGFGRETSSRNSEVIHAGIFYPPSSLKAELCRKGKEMIYALPEDEVSHKRVGKLIVAHDAREIQELERIMENGCANGIDDLCMVSGEEVHALEPYIDAFAALYSPSSGIIDSHALMKHFQRKAAARGVVIAYNTKVVGIEKTSGGYKVTTQDPEGDRFTLLSQVVVNCAGLGSDKIAEMAGICIDSAGYRLHFFKSGDFRIGHQGKVSRLVYPVPARNGSGLGIHLTIDLTGRLKLGPNARDAAENSCDYLVDSSQQQAFYIAGHRFMPSLTEDELQPDMAGIRPRLGVRGGPSRDFVIKEESQYGLPRFINLIGIDSPGLTAAPAIGAYVRKIVQETK